MGIITGLWELVVKVVTAAEWLVAAAEEAVFFSCKRYVEVKCNERLLEWLEARANKDNRAIGAARVEVMAEDMAEDHYYPHERNGIALSHISEGPITVLDGHHSVKSIRKAIDRKKTEGNKNPVIPIRILSGVLKAEGAYYDINARERSQVHSLQMMGMDRCIASNACRAAGATLVKAYTNCWRGRFPGHGNRWFMWGLIIAMGETHAKYAGGDNCEIRLIFTLADLVNAEWADKMYKIFMHRSENIKNNHPMFRVSMLDFVRSDDSDSEVLKKSGASAAGQGVLDVGTGEGTRQKRYRSLSAALMAAYNGKTPHVKYLTEGEDLPDWFFATALSALKKRYDKYRADNQEAIARINPMLDVVGFLETSKAEIELSRKQAVQKDRESVMLAAASYARDNSLEEDVYVNTVLALFDGGVTKTKLRLDGKIQ